MEQDPKDVMLKEEDDKEIQEHVGDGVQAVVAELNKAADFELQQAKVVQVDDVKVHTAEVVQLTKTLQEDQVMQPDWEIIPVGDEWNLREWMKDGKSLERQAGDPVQILDLQRVEKVPEKGTQCR